MSDNQAPQVPLPVSPGPVIIDNQTASKIDKPKTEDELAAESARLNDDSETAQAEILEHINAFPATPSVGINAEGEQEQRDVQADNDTTRQAHADEEGDEIRKRCFCF